MFVRDAPVAIDFAQPHGKPEKKTILVHGVAGRIASTPHDGCGEGDLRTRSNGEFPEVKGCAGFVVAKKQVPRPGVRFNAPALKRRRQIEHHHFSIMMREDRGKIVTTDSVCPALKHGIDQGYFGVGRFRHGRSPCCDRRTFTRSAYPTPSPSFFDGVQTRRPMYEY